MTARGLVLGGGGPVGSAWYAGLAEGLGGGGVDLSGADVIVGTSAGAVAGAWFASGSPLHSYVEAVLRLAGDQADAVPAGGFDLELVGSVYALLAGAEAPLEPLEARKIGVLAAQAVAPTDDPERYVQDANYLPDVSWPSRLRAAVVNARTGELVLIGPVDGVPLDVGVAASCAAPGLIAPVILLGEAHIDGGARSATNADAVLPFAVGRALIASPIPSDTPMVGKAIERVLEEECRRLQAADVDVRTIVPTMVEREAFGFDLLNLTKMSAAIEAGRERGRREATRLRDWWAGR